MNQTRRLTLMAIFVAVGVVGSIWFPSLLLLMYPIQHTVNAMVEVSLGTRSSVGVTFMIGLLTLLTGTSSLLGFPGGMIGAFCSVSLSRKFQKRRWAVVGETTGTA